MGFKKKMFFDIHSWIGVRLGILFFVVCFSGTLATLSHEMDWLFIPEIRAMGDREERASANLLIENFRKAHPNGSITFILHTEEPYLCDIIYKQEDGQRSYVFANPYTGAIQGEVQLTFQRFFRDLHYYLFIPFQVGHFTVLLFGFLLLISLVTALMFYKKWWHKLFELKKGKGSLMFFRSLHRLVGLWSVPFSIVFSITGIWYFIERADVGGVGTRANPRPPEIKSQSPTAVGSFDPLEIDWDRARTVAERSIPGMQVGSVLPPKSALHPIYITGYSQVPLVRQRANRVYLNPVTYEPVQVQRATNLGTIMYLNDIADPLHFGYWGGWVTKIIWFIMGLGISSLVLSGLWIAFKRKAVQRLKRAQPIMGAWRYANWGIFALMLAFMYAALIDRYQASAEVIIVITGGFLAFLFAAWYIFVFRLNRSARKSLNGQESRSMVED